MIAVVIPAYKVKSKILEVVRGLDSLVDKIIVVDDCCPEKSGAFLQANCQDPRLIIEFHTVNLGVGGAVSTGYKKALEIGARIIVKLDGDGQMDQKYILDLVKPIREGKVDYAKGNRFYSIEYVRVMPKFRLFGNSMLSIINKFVNGYWTIMDPTNGFTAISRNALEKIELKKISKRYFFESDMLFRLSIHRAVVCDVPIPAKYEDEESNLSITKVFFSFPPKYVNRYLKRIFYLYFLRDFNAGTIQLVFGSILFSFGLVFGAIEWIHSMNSMVSATAGTIMLASLPIILGFQLLLGFLYFDINNQPTK